MATKDATISVPADVAADIQALVRSGEFQSEGDVARAVMDEWRARREGTEQTLARVRSDVALGLADVTAMRTKAFDVDRIAVLGRQASRRRSTFG